MERIEAKAWDITFGENGFVVSSKNDKRKLHFLDHSVEWVSVEYGNTQWTLGNTIELCRKNLIPEIRHGSGFEAVKLKSENIVEVTSSCGQKVTVKLDDIDEDQDIEEVVIRGVKYVPK